VEKLSLPPLFAPFDLFEVTVNLDQRWVPADESQCHDGVDGVCRLGDDKCQRPLVAWRQVDHSSSRAIGIDRVSAGLIGHELARVERGAGHLDAVSDNETLLHETAVPIETDDTHAIEPSGAGDPVGCQPVAVNSESIVTAYRSKWPLVTRLLGLGHPGRPGIAQSTGRRPDTMPL